MRTRCAQPLCRKELQSPRTRPEPSHASRVGGGARDPEAGAQPPGGSPAGTWSYDGRGHRRGAAPARACGVSGHLAQLPFPDRRSSIRPDTRAHGSCPEAQRVKQGKRAHLCRKVTILVPVTGDSRQIHPGHKGHTKTPSVPAALGKPRAESFHWDGPNLPPPLAGRRPPCPGAQGPASRSSTVPSPHGCPLPCWQLQPPRRPLAPPRGAPASCR